MRWRWLDPGPRWDETTLWALDLEASGLDPRRDCILAVGMVPLRAGRVRWGERWSSLVAPEPGVSSTSGALKVHHILPGELEGAPALPVVLDAVLTRLGDGALLVHWAQLDIEFLRRACRRAGRAWPDPWVVDTVRMMARLSGRRRMIEPHAEPYPSDLVNARRALGLPGHRAHRALDDALATAELFLAARHRLGVQRLGRLG